MSTKLMNNLNTIHLLTNNTHIILLSDLKSSNHIYIDRNNANI